LLLGFQAVDRLGNVTTLGRGGSDLTAVALACSLKAKKCEIYTDVDGVFSSDPRIITRSKLLKRVSYDEMLEAATAGAKVLHNRSVNVAKKFNLSLNVKNSNNLNKGSIVQKNELLETSDISFISKLDNLTKICIIRRNVNN
jgi:aspartate kinase